MRQILEGQRVSATEMARAGVHPVANQDGLSPRHAAVGSRDKVQTVPIRATVNANYDLPHTRILLADRRDLLLAAEVVAQGVDAVVCCDLVALQLQKVDHSLPNFFSLLGRGSSRDEELGGFRVLSHVPQARRLNDGGAP